MILHLGVADLPYSTPESAPRKPPKKPGKRPRKSIGKSGEVMTTGDVAEILEAKYHVIEHFAQLHEGDIAHALENSMQGALESVLMGAPVSQDIFGSATSEIEDAFRKMIDSKELDTIGYPGIPTAAAEKGVSHRFKRPYVRRPARPSFQDTGLYETSFKSWVT
jgi:hypothetical protein